MQTKLFFEKKKHTTKEKSTKNKFENKLCHDISTEAKVSTNKLYQNSLIRFDMKAPVLKIDKDKP